MSFLDKIEEIQKRPEGERRKLLAVLMVICVAVIFSTWVLTFRFSLKNKQKLTEKETDKEEIVKDTKSPFAVLKEGLSEGIDKVGELFSAAKDKAEELKQEIEKIENNIPESDSEENLENAEDTELEQSDQQDQDLASYSTTTETTKIGDLELIEVFDPNNATNTATSTEGE